ncbi:glycosyltransferase BC10-like [Silene latifolia]|uniref:glycosyltransferase BC10-like n=1 Tax=Silene latifolia TaxID=37657 RepID=UPI003D77F1D0
MKTPDAWRISMKILPMHHRPRHASKRPKWMLVLACFIGFFLICGYVYPPQNSSAFTDWLPPSGRREITDEELASQVLTKEMLKSPLPPTKNPKIAFMFLTTGSLPFEKLWDKFFSGHEGKFSIYVHASQRRPVHESSYFVNSDIRSDKVVWGQISMIDAERRLLGYALKDTNNHHFVLLSDSCVPLHKFEYVYNFLMYSNLSYIDSFLDPGPHGNERFSPHMLPEIQKKDFRKGAQWFTLKRQHALIVISDNLYYSKFKNYCKPGFEGRNCYSDEHYIPTLFNMIDPGGMANWSVTHVDWSEHKWHPKSYRSQDVSYELLQNLTSIDEFVHETSESWTAMDVKPCLWNGVKRPCYLFARKFYPETLSVMTELFSNYTSA